MKLVIILGLFLALGFSNETNAQSGSTKLLRFEIDGKKVRRNYKIFFRVNDKLVVSKKTSTGFVIPSELKNDEHLTVLITLGKYRLEFTEVHISKFNEKWVVGVDNRPFSDEIDYLVDNKTVERVYYIHFVGSSLETRLIVTEKSKN